MGRRAKKMHTLASPVPRVEGIRHTAHWKTGPICSFSHNSYAVRYRDKSDERQRRQLMQRRQMWRERKKMTSTYCHRILCARKYLHRFLHFINFNLQSFYSHLWCDDLMSFASVICLFHRRNEIGCARYNICTTRCSMHSIVRILSGN